MAPKKSPSPKKQQQPPTSHPDSHLTPEAFTRDLQSLAAKARTQTTSAHLLAQLKIYLSTLTLLSLAALTSIASQHALSPTYGSIPSSQWHNQLVAAACFVGWSGNLFLGRALPFRPILLLPVFSAFVIPGQWFLTRKSELLGVWGPVVTEAVTIFPVIALSAACVATYLDGADLGWLPSWVRDAAPGLGSYGVFKAVEGVGRDVLGHYAGRTVVNTRVGMEMVLGAGYALLAPSRMLAWAVPALVHTAVWNTHVPTRGALERLNGTLGEQGWMVLDRWESVTGYVSVIESKADGFRLMRCDHSLLGGEWVKFIGHPHFEGNQVAEPVYGVFAMLEAVRLVKMPKKIMDKEAKALVVGLGVGTTPGALVAHGIDTTVVEIDPAVHEFASKYFQLPKNHTAVIEDAVSYTDRLASATENGRFDYIIHDVFTGGAEPIALFTLEFLQNLHTLLKPGGVVAINYAGDFALPPPMVVVKTIRQVFPSCRIFREHPRDEEMVKKHGSDFANMVIFCTKIAGRELSFRQPSPRDLLNSPSREVFLMPKHEVMDEDFTVGRDDGILTKNDTAKLVKWHGKSALGHWKVMRTVLPPSVWENW
ncbi:polyamine aminopropyltransferase [Podospora aff. communis PSN243]|uniref:Polyamine aminopropyltransferase n=1 Tax=Podospora aff. communis PSN243 TaxID=3040156 RepID=A0AAV9GYZ5_9PEZI|nr:polyamine aminopropyltransferase [Podospora aff. communis PSN243]